MIKENITEGENHYMAGMEVVAENAMEVLVTEGTYHRFTGEEEKVFEVPAFSFDILPDSELSVVYDVYLVDDDVQIVRVERTEITPETIPFYDGEKPLLHTLLSMSVPPGSSSLEDVIIQVNRVVKHEDRTD